MGLSKRPGRELAEEKTTRASIYEFSDEFVKRIVADMEKKGVKFYTPYALAQAYNLKIGVAKRVLRRGVELGLLKLYSPDRRSPIFVLNK